MISKAILNTMHSHLKNNLLLQYIVSNFIFQYPPNNNQIQNRNKTKLKSRVNVLNKGKIVKLISKLK